MPAEELRNKPGVLELLPEEHSRRRSRFPTLRQRRTIRREPYGGKSSLIKLSFFNVYRMEHPTIWGFDPFNHITSRNAPPCGGAFLLGADDGIRVFEALAITGLQLVEKVSAHSFHQKSHSFSDYSQSQ